MQTQCESGSSVVLYSVRFCSVECSASGVAQCESGRCYGVKLCEVKCGAAHCERGRCYGVCDSTGSRVPILPGTDSTGSYRVLLLYTTVRLSYRRSHLQRPHRS